MIDLFKSKVSIDGLRSLGLVDDSDDIIMASHAHAITQADDGWYLRLINDAAAPAFISAGWEEIPSDSTPWQK